MEKKKKQIHAIYKRVGFDPVEVTVDNELEALQRMVGGYLETVRIQGLVRYRDIILLCDEEGKLDNRPINFMLPDGSDAICGSVLFVGANKDEFADIPVGLVELHAVWPDLWEVNE